MATPEYSLEELFEDWEFFEEKEFNKEVRDSWILTEFPNMNDTEMLVSLFKMTKKELLMVAEDLKYFNNLPDKIKVFRGINDSQTKKKGLSWTFNRDVAVRFANAWNRQGEVLEAVINKEDVIAVFLDRKECEIVLNPNKLMEVKEYE